MNLSVRNVSKRFGGVQALQNASVDYQSGEIHALCGENGAGKSTLGKVLAGLYEPDSGTIELDGKAVRFRDPRDAQAAGVSIIHQELLFAENLTVADNLRLADLPHRWGLVDHQELNRTAREWLAKVGAEIDPQELVQNLPVSKQQLVQIAAGVGRGARVLIFDEPTSALTNHEAERLLALIQELAATGTTCLYVSHRLEEIYAISHRITVLRDGHTIGTWRTEDLPKHRLIEEMVGREVTLNRQASSARELVALTVQELGSRNRFRDVSLQVRSGEILGIGGLVGAGRTELLEAIFGLDPAARGSVSVDGVPLPLGQVDQSIKRGIGLIPEDQKRNGLVLGMSVRQNSTLTILSSLSPTGIISRTAEASRIQPIIDRLRVRTPSLETPVKNLSGGNQQKVVLAKWLAINAKVLLIDEPTRGVDVGAKEEIYALLREAARKGTAILVVSSELSELRSLCDRIMIMRSGELVGEFPGDAEENELMAAMTGAVTA